MIEPLSPGDFPANPLEKPGYRLEFNDEFEAPGVDTARWFPFYLPHWSSRTLSAPNTAYEDGHLVLQITRGQQPWCPEFDGEVKCSSIQTGEFAGPPGSPFGQHRFNPALVVREAQPALRTYTPQYGYFEARVKGVNTRRNHVALWMIGFEDLPERSGEIAIFEIMGAFVSATSSRVGHGVRRWSDPHLKDEFAEPFLGMDATHFHVYALEWFPDHLDFFIDNLKYKTIHQSPHYPMQFLLSIYELSKTPDGSSKVDQNELYPKKFVIDYFRAYQPLSGY